MKKDQKMTKVLKFLSLSLIFFQKKHRFEKNEEKILENAFSLSSKLDSSLLIDLYLIFFFHLIFVNYVYLLRKKTLNCNDVQIKRWFAYRNKKLQKIQKTELFHFLILVFILIVCNF